MNGLTRQEQFDALVAGKAKSAPKPLTRDEQFSVQIAETIKELAEGGGSGGTTNFNLLTNRPKIEGLPMDGNTNISSITIEEIDALFN